MGETSSSERREIFRRINSSHPFVVFFYIGCLIFVDKMNALKKVFDITKERNVNDATTISLDWAHIPSRVGSSIRIVIRVPMFSPSLG